MYAASEGRRWLISSRCQGTDIAVHVHDAGCKAAYILDAGRSKDSCHAGGVAVDLVAFAVIIPGKSD